MSFAAFIFPNGLGGLYNITNRGSIWTKLTGLQCCPFRQPERVFFNSFNQNEMWVTSFGNGLKVGSISPTGISEMNDNHPIRVYPNPF